MGGNLVIDRHEGERIVCRLPGGGEMVIELVSTRRGKAKLAIKADESIVILREELVGLNGNGKQ